MVARIHQDAVTPTFRQDNEQDNEQDNGPGVSTFSHVEECWFDQEVYDIDII